MTTFLVIFLLSNIKMFSSSLFLEENQIVMASSQNSLIFDSNENNIINIDKIEQSLIKEQFKIDSFHTGKLISLIFLDSFEHNNQSISICVCQLLQSITTYDIVCIDGISPFGDQPFQYHQKTKKYQINLSIVSEKQCKELYVDFQNQLLIVCQSQYDLTIQRINLQNQSQTIFNVSHDLNFMYCKTKIFNIDKKSILAFYQCRNWRLIQIQEAGLLTIMKQDFVLNVNPDVFVQIKHLNEIFICQNQLHLIEQQNYYIFDIIDGNLLFQHLQKGENSIQYIKFTENCEIYYKVAISNQQMEASLLNFNKETKEILINNYQEEYEIFANNQYLFFKVNTQLDIILCNFLNQTHQIGSSQLNFVQAPKFNSFEMQFPQLFFQIDNISQSAIFYEYYNFLSFIKPTKRFLYKLDNFNIFTTKDDKEIIIKEIIYPKINSTESYQVYSENYCQPSEQIQFQKKQNGLPYMYEFYQQNEYQIIQGINDEEDFDKQIQGQSILKIDQVISYDIRFGYQKKAFLVYVENKKLQIYTINDNKLIYSADNEDLLIFTCEIFIATVSLKNNQLTVLMVLQNMVTSNQQNLNKKIESVTQSSFYLIFLFIDKTFQIINLQNMKTIYLNEDIEKLGIPIFYVKVQTQVLIQYENFILSENKSGLKIIELKNLQIFSVSHFFPGILIRGVHKIKDLIIIYHFDGKSLVLKDELSITIGKFVRPLILSCAQNFVAIATIQNFQNSIIVFDVGNTIQILTNKLCYNFNFILQHQNLIYFNQYNKLKILNLNYYSITIQNRQFQFNPLDTYLENIQIMYQYQNQSISVKKILKITIYNHCYKLFKIQNQTYEIKNTKLSLNELFQGPIVNLTIDNQDAARIQGPFLIEQSLNNGNNNFSDQNLIVYEIVLKSTKAYFVFKCHRLLEFCWLNHTELNGIKLINEGWMDYYNSTVLLNIIKLTNKFYSHTFQINHQKRQLVETFYKQINEISDETEIQQYNLKNCFVFLRKVGNIYPQQSLLYFNDQSSYEIFSIKNELLCICQMKNQNNLFLLIEKSSDFSLNSINFQLVSFKQKEMFIFFSFKLGESFWQLVEDNFFQGLPSFSYTLKQITFCNQDAQLLEVNLFFVFIKFSCEIKMIYNNSTGQQDYYIQKIIRNPNSDKAIILHYYDSSILILKTYEQKSYLYDLSNKQSLYDYIGQIDVNIKLSKIHNTYYLLTQFDNRQIVEIGYIIEKVETLEKSVTFNLMASNEVSQAELEIYLKFDQETVETQIWMFHSRIQLLLIVMLLIFIVFIIRRKKLKLQKIENKHISLVET